MTFIKKFMVVNKKKRETFLPLGTINQLIAVFVGRIPSSFARSNSLRIFLKRYLKS
jgi:hypothetical protein